MKAIKLLSVSFRLFWEFNHQMISHPLMFVTRNADWAVRFHHWTGDRAWPEEGGNG